MAKLKELHKQEEALKKVGSLIKSIRKSQSFMCNRPNNGVYNISYFVADDDYGTVYDSNLKIFDMCIVDGYINKYIDECKIEIKSLCNTYQIELDQKEKELLR